MGTLLYNINEDKTTDPVSFYPSAVESGELSTEDISELINEKEPLITADTARTVINELSAVCSQLLNWGNWALLEDFIQIYTSLTVNFGTDYNGDVQPEDLDSLADAQNQLEEDTEAITNYVLNRYTFPKAPFIKSTLETKHNIIDHITGNWGCYLYGEDFGASMDDDETGVWMESPAGNNYQQINNISFTSGTIIFVPEVVGELGPGGVNSVEHILTVRGRYVPEDPIEIGNEFLVRAINPIGAGNIEMFLVGAQTGGVCEFMSHDECTCAEHILLVDANTSEIYQINGEPGPAVEIDGDGDYKVFDSEGHHINLLIHDAAQLLANAAAYGGQIIEVLSFEDITFFSFETTYGPGAPFTPIIVKSGTEVSWYFGNGDSILVDNTPSYSGYVNSDLKVVTVFDIDDFLEITEMHMDNLNIEGNMIELSLFSSLTVFTIYTNNLYGSISDLSNNTDIILFYCQENNITGSIPSLINCLVLEQFFCNDNAITGNIPDVSNNTVMTHFECTNNNLTGYNGGLDSTIDLTYLGLYNNDITSQAISDIIDDLWEIRSSLGANACIIGLNGGTNGTPDTDAVAKIEGLAPYTGDGLKDAGCTVTYNV